MTVLLRWFSDTLFFLRTFFPVKLFFLQLRRSHLLMLFWLILFGFITGFIGFDYGFRYLFVSPEYQEQVGPVSYLLLGFTMGLFFMAYHINSYIYYSYRFPFLAAVDRPLWKFGVNNSIIPLTFYLTLAISILKFSIKDGYPLTNILLNQAALFLGATLSIGFTVGYFLSTIKTLAEKKGDSQSELSGVRTLRHLINIGRKRTQVSQHPQAVNYYLKNFYTLRLTRNTQHYSKEALSKTIEQHHLSATFYFILLLLVLLGLGFIGSNPYFRIPAGATVFLIFSIYLMIIGAIYVRLKTWTVTVGVLLLVGFHFLTAQQFFTHISYAFGMDYQSEPAQYNYQTLEALTADSLVRQDKHETLKRLEAWRAKFPADSLPKLVVYNVSGGGLRSTLWTMLVMQRIDSLLGPAFYDQVHLITGSSGGMLGAAYYRELQYQKTNLNTIIRPNNPYYSELASKDLLNATTFYLAVNDLLFRLKRVNLAGCRYPLDRGYAFDQRWLENTQGLLDYPFTRNQKAESEAQIPTLILAPTIIGDGRKLLMSTQGLSYLTYNQPLRGLGKSREFDGVEYQRLFAGQGADSLRFATALRLSASFPYITPLVTMPSEPPMQLIDAGVRDNEGLELALRYLYTFRDWIAQNTSGVHIIQIKANRVDQIPIESKIPSRLESLVRPISGVVKSFSNLQIYNKSLLMDWSGDLLGFPLKLSRFSLMREKENLSLSWHLTEQEKEEIHKALSRPDNLEAMQNLKEELKKKPATTERDAPALQPTKQNYD